MVRKEILALSLLVSLTKVQGQEIDWERALRALFENAIEIKIAARILPYNEKPIWDIDISKLTIPGRSVVVQLIGNNLRIFAIFTPYRLENETILLVAQGQIWLTEPPENKVKYLSAYRSIPLVLGEKILFFPLGLTSEIVKKDFFNIELEIQIELFKDE